MQKYLLAMILLMSLTLPALAGDWTAARLRGAVLAEDIHGDGQWHLLQRGDTVPDDRPIRTLASGNVTFTRGSETIAFGPGTEARIVDRRGQDFTTVVQQSGRVSVEADARKVQHFAIETPFLVALVKGTVFSVSTTGAGSRVAVSRGLVAVTDRQRHRTVMLPAGQQLFESAAGQLQLFGAADPALAHPVIDGVVEDSTAVGDGGTGYATTARPAGAGLANAVTDIGGELGDAAGGLTGGLGATTGQLGTSLGRTVDSAGGSVGTVGGALGHGVTGAGATAGKTLGRLGL